MGFVGPEQPVPPWEIEAIVAVRLPDDHRMMNPVHVGGHHDEPKNPVNGFRNMDVAVVEHGSAVERHLKDEDRKGREKEG